MLRVEPARIDDLAAVHAAYAHGRALQRAGGVTAVWPEFTDDALLAEIAAGELLRVVDGATLAGVFTVTDADPLIWWELERGAHLYLHRIARAAGWKGRGLTEAVVDWAEARCRALGREGLRLDTWADNAVMLAHYERLGFVVVGRHRLKAAPRLLVHYHGLDLALLERGCSPSIPLELS